MFGVEPLAILSPAPMFLSSSVFVCVLMHVYDGNISKKEWLNIEKKVVLNSCCKISVNIFASSQSCFMPDTLKL